MRQTIECEECVKVYVGRSNLTEVHGEQISKTAGFPLGPGLRCDGCGKELLENQLVVAVGVWVEDRGIYNIAGWFADYIREPSKQELKAYREVELSAKILKEPNTACSGCGQQIDLNVCGCGSSRDCHSNPMNDGHGFIPLGCDCHRDKGGR